MSDSVKCGLQWCNNRTLDPSGRCHLHRGTRGAGTSPPSLPALPLPAELPQREIPRSVQEVIDNIVLYAEEIEFPDNGASAVDDEYVTLSEMEDGDRAGNNCFSASNEVARALVEQIGLEPDQECKVVQLEFSNNGTSSVHVANLLQQGEGEGWVLDFTARQFDPEVEWPLAMPLEQWEGWIAEQVRVQYGDALEETSILW